MLQEKYGTEHVFILLSGYILSFGLRIFNLQRTWNMFFEENIILFILTELYFLLYYNFDEDI